MIHITKRRSSSYSENVFKRAARQDHDPFLRGQSNSRKSLHTFRQQHVIVRYGLVFTVGFVIGAVIEFFACKTHLYEAVMANKDVRRHQMDEFVVDLRRNMDKWQREDIAAQGGRNS
jgi:hypothetical protein